MLEVVLVGEFQLMYCPNDDQLRGQEMVSGKCNCGAISFEISADISDVFVCHCSICRSATGSSGIAVVVIPNHGFHWLRGEELITSWKKPDSHWQIWFCPTCGSPVPGINDESRMFVPAGSITEGGESLQVKHHIWVDSKADWDEIGDAGLQHMEEFNG